MGNCEDVLELVGEILAAAVPIEAEGFQQALLVLHDELSVESRPDLGHLLGLGTCPHVAGANMVRIEAGLRQFVGIAISPRTVVGAVVVGGEEVLVDVLLQNPRWPLSRKAMMS